MPTVSSGPDSDLDQQLTGMAPEQWPTLVPGDPEQITALAGRLRTTAANLREQSRRLVAVDPDTYWKGDAARAFAQRKQQLPPLLNAAEERYHRTGDALTTYGNTVREARETAQNAAREGTEARQHVEAAGYPITDWPKFYGGGTDPIDPIDPVRPVRPVQPIRPPITPPVLVDPPVRLEPLQPVEPGMPIQQPVQPVEPGQPVAPVQPPLTTHHPVATHPPVAVTAEYERFGAAVKLMESAVTTYRAAARRAAQAIQTASHDSLCDSPGYSADLSKLKSELTENLAGLAPTMRAQIAKLTGVAGLLGWIPVVGMVTGKDRHALAQQLSTDAANWQAGRTDGKTVIDDFLKVLDPGTAAPGSSGHVTSHTVPVVA